MPSSFTHYLVGRAVCRLLPFPFSAFFEIGCQGGDFGFFYPALSFRQNLGKTLHYGDPYLFFTRLSDYCTERRQAIPYALGYLTHYCADVCFHPYIGGRKDISHATMERALDAYFLRKEGREEYRIPVKMLSSGEKGEIARLFSLLTGRPLTEKRVAYSFSALDFATRRMIPCISRRFLAEETAREKEIWERLFSSSVSLGRNYCRRFLTVTSGEGVLEKTDFMRDFSGKIF